MRFAFWCETQHRLEHAFFSARRIVSPGFGQIEIAVQQHLKIRRCVGKMDSHSTVFNLTAIAIVLSLRSDGMVAALGCAGLIDAPNRVGMSMLLSDNRLTAVTQFFFVPLNRFEKTLQRSRFGIESQRDGLDTFSLHI